MIESEGGFFVASTVIVGISQQHAIVQEDIFGSVLTALPYDDLSQAVVLANDTVYGQAANVWSENISRVHHVIARLKNSKGAVNTEGFPHPVLPEGA
ncbi:aldehyde dehydrogenase family protein [Pseudomonas silesiensis]|uniref:aldehyde dehydrogenase family protein n=1 Tax=Pseudomonas silesiensis TaxID=1853130 RepID=UPI0030D9B6E2